MASQQFDSKQAHKRVALTGFQSYLLPGVVLTVLLLILAAFRPLALPDEGRYAEIGRWMVVSGDWLAPRLNGLPFFHKPPLLYRLEAIVIQGVGPTIWGLRFIPALHAVIVLGLMGPMLDGVFGTSVARRSMIIFGSSAAFLLGGQYINHDMMVACWISVAIAAFGSFAIQLGLDEDLISQQNRAVPNKLRRMAWLGFIACALGVLSKGLIGVVLPCFVLFLWLCWSGRWSVLREVPWFSGLLIFLSMTLPWFVLTEQVYPGMVDYMFGVHQFERFTGTQFNNAQPFWFYGVAISLLLGPWMVWFWGYQLSRIYGFCINDRHLSFAFKLKHLVVQFTSSKQAQRTDAQLVVGLCLIWVWAIVIFFSIPHSKIIGYVLPVTPPMALLCALGWDRLMSGTRFEILIWRTSLILSVASMVLINNEATKMTRRYFSVDVANVLRCQDLQNAQLMVVGDYPYDLPFLTNTTLPMWVIQDWVFERAHAGDTWRRELFEGANFEPVKAEILKPPSTLLKEASQSQRWLLVPTNWNKSSQISSLGYALVFQGGAWSIYRTQSTVAYPTTQDGVCLR